ncbi:phosphotyrosine protein phosphatase [Devosia epidermidihirudinis]|uniref:Phosphotyrosine protein phosphatase n=1 Tax=Devosia epidermidihirudinis TaxID=1293439 RepID=A0A0F5Q9D9_9HYPH|nr:low molecular weight protein tyrosine phosphatase family protein [Devosia epidermidihirudinis]KKC36634.1 phosphotyrosine protein phosphatase [Devosia epidermidihirudinis]
MNALFICSRNRLRSPTAQAVFASWENVETDSAGTSADADIEVSADHIDWADTIFVMEGRHRALLAKRFQRQLKGKQVICLEIRDNYTFMQPELIEILIAKVGRHLHSPKASLQ